MDTVLHIYTGLGPGNGDGIALNLKELDQRIRRARAGIYSYFETETFPLRSCKGPNLF